MTRAVLVLANDQVRERAVNWCRKVPVGTRLEFKAPRRSLSQNARLWAMLTDVAKQVPWHGLRLSPDDYKLLFLDALKREVRLVPNLDSNGFVSLGRSSSDLTKEEMGDLFSLIEAFGATHGVIFHDNPQGATP